MANRSPIEIHHGRVVLKAAVASRLILLALIITWRSLLRPYDTSASIHPSCLSPSSSHDLQLKPTIIFPRIASAIEDSVVWDGIYFIRIAECGYEYEQYYAFFPLLPICISLLSRTVFAMFVPLFGYRAVLALSGYVINNIAFVLTAICLYRLSVIILKDRGVALRASILFCFNPASIFYSSIYTETLYALLSIGGVYKLMSGGSNVATLMLALSGAARSNGVINAGYICYRIMHSAYDAVFRRRNFYVLVAGALRCLCILVPFIAFQAYGYCNFCLGLEPNQLRLWCKARLPLMYNYIQSHYWGVGFLRYFELKQLPNFLLATPILSLSLCSIIHFVKLQPELFLSLGFPVTRKDNASATDYVVEDHPSRTQGNQIFRRRRRQVKHEDVITSSDAEVASYESEDISVSIIPFVLHLGFMSATAFLVMHVQVATRFLSASPPVYWYASHLMASPGVGKKWGHLIWAYCTAYILLGSLLFSNFYPFT